MEVSVHIYIYICIIIIAFIHTIHLVTPGTDCLISIDMKAVWLRYVHQQLPNSTIYSLIFVVARCDFSLLRAGTVWRIKQKYSMYMSITTTCISCVSLCIGTVYLTLKFVSTIGALFLF